MVPESTHLLSSSPAGRIVCTNLPPSEEKSHDNWISQHNDDKTSYREVNH